MFYQQIIDRINEERDAQDLKWGSDHDDDHTVHEWTGYVRHQLTKGKRLHQRKLIIVGAMAVACLESMNRRFKINKSREEIYEHSIRRTKINAYVCPIHTCHKEVIDDLIRDLDGGLALWSRLAETMTYVLDKVFVHLSQDVGHKIVDKTSDSINPRWEITENKSEKTFEVKAGLDHPTVTLTFHNIDDAVEALMSIAHLDMIQR